MFLCFVLLVVGAGDARLRSLDLACCLVGVVGDIGVLLYGYMMCVHVLV